MKVIIYCVGGLAEKIVYSLDDKKIDVVAIADGNPAYSGGVTTTLNIPVISPDEIKSLDYDYVMVALEYHFDEIKADLIQKGVDGDKIVVYRQEKYEWDFLDERVSQMRKCMELIRRRNVAGEMAELGVYKGDFSCLLNCYMPERNLYLFDTFEGFNSDRDVVASGDIRNFKDTSEKLVMSKMEHPKKCIVRKGYFPDTALGLEEEKFCFVSLDCDLYEPMIAGLEYFYPRLSHGGYIFVHDFGNRHYPGAGKAVIEFCDREKIGFIPLMDQYNTVIISK